METLSPPPPATGLSTSLYYQLVYTLTGLLPPPLDDSPQALHARNLAAIAKVAALLPVNANEIDLAAQCIAARAQAEEMLRLLRQNADDIGLAMRLNAQYGSMVRTSLSVHGRLMRVQAVRQKREAAEGSANQDAWTQHVAERSMLQVVASAAGWQEAASPEAAPAEAVRPEAVRPEAVRPEAARAAEVDPGIADNISENDINSHDAAFETLLSAPFWNQGAKEPGGTGLREVLREMIAKSHSAGRAMPAKVAKGRTKASVNPSACSA